MSFEIKQSNAVVLHNTEDETDIYMVFSSGFANEEERYLVVDVGPHFYGSVEHVSKEKLLKMFGLVAEQPEFDKI